MDSYRPRAASSVRTLARQLTRRAALGLGALVAFGLVCALVALAGAGQLLLGDMTLGSALGHAAMTLVAALLASRAWAWLVVPPPPAEGVRIERASAPSLYRLVDRIAERSGAPGVDRIRISSDMNAALHQRPVHGVWGRMETTLIIGLPLVHSVSPRQLAAIIAHEMGHLVRQRKGMLAWDAHIRAWWHRSCERLAEDERPCARLLAWAIGGAMERDLLDALHLNHLEEYEADRVAARIVGAKLLGDTLVEVAMKADFIESDYWDKVMAQAEHSPRPTIRPFRDMGMGVAAGFHALRDSGMLRSLVCEENDSLLHPTLTDRLVALRIAPRMPERSRRSAAAHYLNPALPSLSRRFDGQWWRAIRPAWRRYYRECRQSDDADE